MATKDKKRNVKICLLGASFDTGNLGVSALAESSIKIIINRWPNAEITLLGAGYVPGEYHLSIMGREISAPIIPIRFCKNIFLPYHFLRFAFYGLFSKILPGSQAKDILFNLNRYVGTLYKADLVLDITGGDSFSDIYGLRRFLLNILEKWLVILFSKNLIMLPQTYGPFNKRLTRALARYILNHAIAIYSRDRNGVEFVKHLLKTKNAESKVKFSPEVAFVLDAHKPEGADIRSLGGIWAKNKIVVGLNVSGLLFNGGYTRNNMFGLRTNYQHLIQGIIELLLKRDNLIVLLVPHMLPGHGVESDHDACSKVFQETVGKYKGRIILVKGRYNHNEVKYIIGKCDFLIGSRMHACIAALSQNIPTVGLAYSEKFVGVFGSIGLEDLVVDMRRAGVAEILTMIDKAFERREAIARHLKALIPSVQQNILNIFEDIS